MTLVLLLLITFAGGVLAWLAGRRGDSWPRLISAAALAVGLGLTVALWLQHFRVGQAGYTGGGPWLVEVRAAWIPQFGIGFHLGVDGLSLVLVALTYLLGLLVVLGSWREASARTGAFYFNLLWVLAGIVGVFLALDLFLFYFFWEVMLVPTYFLFFWGHERRVYAAIKFFVFTQLGGLLMLVAILGLYFFHGQSTGTYTFDYTELLGTAIPAPAATLLMLGFFIAFAVKLPIVPFHAWAPDAYVEAPTAATVILAGLMAKTAGYGLLRFVLPLFPEAALGFAPVATALAVLSILYGAVLAFGQVDLKRLIAYSSVSHMGFVMLGAFAFSELALQGAVMEMIAHGVSTGALFILAGLIAERTGTRDLDRLGGLWSTTPRLGGFFLLFALAALGLPGLGNFVGEFLVLIGTYQVYPVAAALAAVGIVLATAYALRMVQRVLFGPNAGGWQLPDFTRREVAVVGALALAIVWLGLYPQPVLDAARQGLENVRGGALASQAIEAPPLAGLLTPPDGGNR